MYNGLLGDAVEVRLAHVNEAQSEMLTLSGSLSGVLGKQHVLRLERQGRSEEVVMLVALVDLAGGQPATYFRVGQIALVAIDPPAPDEDVPRDLINLVLG